MSSSLLDNERRCYICGTTLNLHRHHIYPGAFRNKSEQYGCWVYLCFDHHVGNHGIHTTPEGQAYARQLKAICQQEFERIHGHEKFMKIFKRNYKNG